MQREDGEGQVNETRPLTGLDVLDVGCGGGLLSEVRSHPRAPFAFFNIIFFSIQTLTRLGGNTLGIDASESNIAIASLHAAADPALSSGSSAERQGSLSYRHTAVENLLSERGPMSFDVVCSMEVIEHVDNPRTFLANCASLVKVRDPSAPHIIPMYSPSLQNSLVAISSSPQSRAPRSPTS